MLDSEKVHSQMALSADDAKRMADTFGANASVQGWNVLIIDDGAHL